MVIVRVSPIQEVEEIISLVLEFKLKLIIEGKPKKVFVILFGKSKMNKHLDISLICVNERLILINRNVCYFH